jgi:hypothetical protein
LPACLAFFDYQLLTPWELASIKKSGRWEEATSTPALTTPIRRRSIMATLPVPSFAHISKMPAFQGEIRSFPVLSAVPAGCFAHLVTDSRSEPVIHAGEFVVVDRNQREPEDGDLYLIRWNTRDVEIVQTVLRPFNFLKNGRTVPGFGWIVAPYRRPRSQEQADEWIRLAEGCRQVVDWFADGPYPVRGEPHGDHLPSKLVGRVIGILEAETEMPEIRRAA